MTSKKEEYRARLVVSWHCIVRACTVLFEDVEPVHLDDEGRDFTALGLCTCSDAVVWCEHWIACTIANRAAEPLQDESNPGNAGDTPALQEPPKESAMDPVNGQAQRIDLIVAYDAGEANLLAGVSDKGRLLQFRLDGDVVVPPTRDMPEIYRWLHEHGYIPDGFNWLGWWEDGHRRQWQSYVLHRVQSG